MKFTLQPPEATCHLLTPGDTSQGHNETSPQQPLSFLPFSGISVNTYRLDYVQIGFTVDSLQFLITQRDKW